MTDDKGRPDDGDISGGDNRDSGDAGAFGQGPREPGQFGHPGYGQGYGQAPGGQDQYGQGYGQGPDGQGQCHDGILFHIVFFFCLVSTCVVVDIFSKSHSRKIFKISMVNQKPQCV